ncbi:MAG: HupE/UreJ family protein [Candidatus Saccharimonadales bacterium]
MKKIILYAFIPLAFFFILTPALASAHELLPQNVTDYIKNNPDASPEEIKQYIEGNAPELSDKVKNQEDVIRIIKQDTNFFDNFYDFLRLGVHHILSGLDHVLFVLSLLLVFAGVANVLRYTLTFTLAHSLTLVLAGTGTLVLSSRIVEPIIALSIAVMAIATVFFRHNKYIKNTKSKLGIIFFFGLFHGLGFAGLLQEINVPDDKFVSSLLAFNIGIEFGQLIVIALALPVIYLLRNKSWYPLLIKIVAVIISTIAIIWIFQRVFG